MSAYVVAMMTVNDPQTYRKYTDLTPPTVKKYGGKFLTRGESVKTIEGDSYQGRMVILEFPNAKQVESWMADPDYQQAMVFRHAASTMHALLLQEGSDYQGDPDPNL